MIEREARDPPVPGFPEGLHEHGSSAEAFDAMRAGGYDWGSVSHHDTNYPGQLANICIDPSSAKFRWWQLRVSEAGFPDATGPTGATVIAGVERGARAGAGRDGATPSTETAASSR